MRTQANKLTTLDYISQHAIAGLQQIQKTHPYGSKEHRAAYDRIREIVKVWKRIDIGPYN